MKTFPGTDGNVMVKQCCALTADCRFWAVTHTAMPVSARQGRASPPDVLKQLLESGSCSVNGPLWQL